MKGAAKTIPPLQSIPKWRWQGPSNLQATSGGSIDITVVYLKKNTKVYICIYTKMQVSYMCTVNE